ncbi:Rhodanese-like protein [Metarhizium album ARSEF 1941]|uniref:Rhodanese-like protein n=1 Tax=Metarhizium album (strain ARSEF 1941) TaxID=1081103 RepID=A0A0B2WIV8_METAS|nr:Rhodanese-like protein [Metarhizium album ARSEF 1941]KHN95986.1 Rhodanese-like protein [Metarhizium album ARSEF 1941]
MAAVTQTQGQDTPPWWSSLPEPKAPIHALEAEDVAQLLESHASAGPNSTKSFLLVDVRRTQWEGGTVTTSLNLPAQTLYQTRPTIYQLCKQANVKTIIFYCGTSKGRGPLCAGWMQDYLNQVGEASISAVILKGGIEGWHSKYGGELMDWYDDKFWTRKQSS